MYLIFPEKNGLVFRIPCPFALVCSVRRPRPGSLRSTPSCAPEGSIPLLSPAYSPGSVSNGMEGRRCATTGSTSPSSRRPSRGWASASSAPQPPTTPSAHFGVFINDLSASNRAVFLCVCVCVCVWNLDFFPKPFSLFFTFGSWLFFFGFRGPVCLHIFWVVRCPHPLVKLTLLLFLSSSSSPA